MARKPRAGAQRRIDAARVAGLLVGATLGLIVVGVSATGAPAPRASAAHVHFACSKHTSAKIPCYFTTPKRNIRCVWSPHGQNIRCIRVLTGHGFVLNPTGPARRITVHLGHAGETLPTVQEIVFPQRLSCHDTRNSLTCNQNEGTGFFTIGPHGSRSG